MNLIALLFIIAKRDIYIRKSKLSQENSWTIVLRAFDIFSSYCCNLQSSFQTSLCSLQSIQNCPITTKQNILLHLRPSFNILTKKQKIIKLCIETNRQRVFRYKNNHYLIADWRYDRWSWWYLILWISLRASSNDSVGSLFSSIPANRVKCVRPDFSYMY